MELQITATVHPKLREVITGAPTAYRRELYSVGANALRLGLQRYIRRQSVFRHGTANRLGGVATGHLMKGAARIVSRSTEDYGTVLVPIAGITRAFADLKISPTKANALTIPIAGAAYGHRVRELERMGWSIFKPKGKDYLMGSHDGEEARPLYALRKSVTVRKDRTLLPTDQQIAATINNAMAMHQARKDLA